MDQFESLKKLCAVDKARIFNTILRYYNDEDSISDYDEFGRDVRKIFEFAEEFFKED
jgi:hypothetical protein